MPPCSNHCTRNCQTPAQARHQRKVCLPNATNNLAASSAWHEPLHTYPARQNCSAAIASPPPSPQTLNFLSQAPACSTQTSPSCITSHRSGTSCRACNARPSYSRVLTGTRPAAQVQQVQSQQQYQHSPVQQVGRPLPHSVRACTVLVLGQAASTQCCMRGLPFCRCFLTGRTLLPSASHLCSVTPARTNMSWQLDLPGFWLCHTAVNPHNLTSCHASTLTAFSLLLLLRSPPTAALAARGQSRSSPAVSCRSWWAVKSRKRRDRRTAPVRFICAGTA